MHSEVILLKYLRQLRRCGADNVSGGYRHMDAVELAFRLAFEELEENMATADAIAELGAANLRIMELQADVERLTDELRIARNGTALAIKNPPFSDGPADSAAPSAISNQQSPINNSMWHGPDMLALLDDEAADWWIGCDTGRHQWRTVPKPVQLRMIRHILSFGPETGNMTMAEFDAIKPAWMPGSGSHTKTLNLSWQQLNDFRVELDAIK